eukprot:5825709-Pleurochrysis_carterae.AAC.1
MKHAAPLARLWLRRAVRSLLLTHGGGGVLRMVIALYGALCATCCALALAVATLSSNAEAMPSVDDRAASKETIVTARTAAIMKV